MKVQHFASFVRVIGWWPMTKPRGIWLRSTNSKRNQSVNCVWYVGISYTLYQSSLRWRHNGRHSVSDHQPHDCLLNCLFRRRSKKTSKLRVAGLCAGNSPVPGEFPAQMASNAENVSIWWRHHVSIFISKPWKSEGAMTVSSNSPNGVPWLRLNQ